MHESSINWDNRLAAEFRFSVTVSSNAFGFGNTSNFLVEKPAQVASDTLRMQVLFTGLCCGSTVLSPFVNLSFPSMLSFLLLEEQTLWLYLFLSVVAIPLGGSVVVAVAVAVGSAAGGGGGGGAAAVEAPSFVLSVLHCFCFLVCLSSRDRCCRCWDVAAAVTVAPWRLGAPGSLVSCPPASLVVGNGNRVLAVPVRLHHRIKTQQRPIGSASCRRHRWPFD